MTKNRILPVSFLILYRLVTQQSLYGKLTPVYQLSTTLDIKVGTTTIAIIGLEQKIPMKTGTASLGQRASVSKGNDAFNPNRSSDFSRIACDCRADFFCIFRRRSGLRQGKDRKKMRGKGMQGGEELNISTFVRSNDRFGFKVKRKIIKEENKTSHVIIYFFTGIICPNSAGRYYGLDADIPKRIDFFLKTLHAQSLKLSAKTLTLFPNRKRDSVVSITLGTDIRFLTATHYYIYKKPLNGTTMIKTGLTHTSTTTVATNNTANSLGSGDMPVFATPAMAALMENAAMLAVAGALPEGDTTVGGQISITHLKPSILGAEVRATAVLEKAEGRKLTFSLRAEDGSSVIGEGTHVRFIVNREKFLQKAGQSNSK